VCFCTEVVPGTEGLECDQCMHSQWNIRIPREIAVISVGHRRPVGLVKAQIFTAVSRETCQWYLWDINVLLDSLSLRFLRRWKLILWFSGLWNRVVWVGVLNSGSFITNPSSPRHKFWNTFFKTATTASIPIFQYETQLPSYSKPYKCYSSVIDCGFLWRHFLNCIGHIASGVEWLWVMNWKMQMEVFTAYFSIFRKC
jgi:hypothetical protein